MAPPPPPVYQLICSVCKGEYCGRAEWLNHLCETNHQQLARKQCLEKRDPKVKSTCLIIFTKKPLTSDKAAKEVLEFFGSKVTSAPVNDFVWWGDRGKIGILRFESREKVQLLLRALGCRRGRHTKIVRFGSQRIYVKAGFKLDKFEWCALLPAREKKSPPSTPMSPVPSAAPKNKKKRDYLQQINQQSSTSSSHPPSPPPKLVNYLDTDSDQDNPSDNRPILKALRRLPSQEEDDEFQVIAIIPNNTKSLSSPCITVTETTTATVFTSYLYTTQCPPHPMTRSSHPLQFEYWTIRRATLIPEDLYQKGMEVVASLKQILSLLFPKLEVIMFRNWNLKLKDTADENDHLLVFIYKADSLNDRRINWALDKKMRVFLSEKDNQITNQFKIVENRPTKLKIINFRTNIMITLVTPKMKDCLEEVQLCRLMEYMCRFDPRCHGVITLACYWVKLNGIKIWDDKRLEDTDKVLHGKYTVPWLVLFFMCKVELIPSVREILKRNPDKFVKELKEWEEGSSGDVGYLGDLSYVEEWRRQRDEGRWKVLKMEDGEEKSEKFVVQLLRIFREFLKFCENDLGKGEGSNDLILSTYDGLLIDGRGPKAAMKAQRDGKVRMATWEVAAVKKVLGEIGRRRRAGGEGDDKRNFVMIHPFRWDWKFSLGEDFGEGLGEMARLGVGRLEGFLKIGRREGGGNAVGGYEGLEEVMRVREMGMEEDE